MGRQPCCVGVGLKKGPWTIEEDNKLVTFILTYGIHCWRSVPKLAGLLRCGKSCRLRWINYLRPDLKRGALSEDEEDQIIQLHARLGNRWSKIASHFPGRTDNEIKNIWNTKIKKRLKVVGSESTSHQLIEEKTKENQEVKNENDLIKKKSGETREMEKEFTNDMSKDIKNKPIPLETTQRANEVFEITEFLEDYEMLLMNEETINIPSLSQNPSIGESSSNSTSSKEDSIQHWLQSVDPIFSWDYFDKLEDGFFMFG